MSKPGTDLQNRVNSIQKTTNPTGIEGNLALLGTALAKVIQFFTRTGKPENSVPSLRGASIEDSSEKNILSDEIMDVLNPKKVKKKKSTKKLTQEELKEKGDKLNQKIKEQAKEAVRPLTKEQNKKSKKLEKRAKRVQKRMREL